MCDPGQVLSIPDGQRDGRGGRQPVMLIPNPEPAPDPDLDSETDPGPVADPALDP